jgi:serine/threonine protein kinase
MEAKASESQLTLDLNLPIPLNKLKLELPGSDPQGYYVHERLGHGTFGVVDSVGHGMRPGPLFARKQIPKENVTNGADLLNEVRLTNLAKHPHVIRIVEQYQDDKFFYIIMEPVATSNLQQHLRKTTSNGLQNLSRQAFGETRLHLF